MKIEEYYQEIVNEIRSTAFSTGDYELATFTNFAIQKLVEAGETPDIDPCQFDFQLRNRKRVRIDGYGYDDVDNSIVALISEYSAADEFGTITKTDIESTISCLTSFIETASKTSDRADLPHTQEAAIAAEAIASKLPTASKIKLLLVTNKKLSERVKQLSSENIAGVRVELGVWDLQRFFQLYQSKLGREELEVEIAEWLPGGLPVLEAPSQSNLLRTYLAVVPGRLLADIFDKHGSRLLEGNVRSFLSARGNVNKGIRATILGKPEFFLAFNNGITATATQVQISSDGSHNITSIKDLQIVNGGQTTASLYNFLKTEKDKIQNLDHVSVQMKLIVVSPEESEKMVPDIARFANSQNKVSEADFFSNSPFHRRMEEISKRIFAPAKNGSQFTTHWFYERARGAYLNEKMRQASPSLQAKFEQQNPRSQVIQKTDFAKYVNAWSCKPHVVSKGSQKNFLEFAQTIADKYETEVGKSEFGDEYFKRVVCMKIIFDTAHKAIPKLEWYETGYLANIVSYALSRLSFELSKTKHQPNWPVIWREQALSSAMEAALLEAARVAHNALTYSPRPQQNVTEWAKTEACWKVCQAMDLSISSKLYAECLSSEEAVEMQVEEKAKARQLTEVELMTKLNQVDAGYWTELLTSSRFRISPAEQTLIKKAQLPNGALLLDAKQLTRLTAVVERANLEGLEMPESFRQI